jgi:polyvinyl alcohol dehydrogenase (cytochrome)
MHAQCSIPGGELLGAERRGARHRKQPEHVVTSAISANVYAIDAANALLWKKQTDTHRSARVTGSVKLHEGKLYVPMSSIEEGPAAQPTYECCTFRGSVVALDAATGDQLWKTYTISETPAPVGKNSKGTTLYGPAGVAVWNSPTIDPQKGILYVGTGTAHRAAVKTATR